MNGASCPDKKPFGTVKCDNQCELDESECRKGWVQISADPEASNFCALDTEGKISCGSGIGMLNLITGGGSPVGNFSEVSVGTSHSCGLTNSGEIKCWMGQTVGTLTTITGSFSAISVGNQFVCGLTQQSRAECYNFDGTSMTIPTGNFRDLQLSAISSGNNYACGLLLSGALACVANLNGDGTGSAGVDSNKRYDDLVVYKDIVRWIRLLPVSSA